MPETGVDILFGTGGAPEKSSQLRADVLEEKFKVDYVRNQSEIDRMEKMGITDPNKIYQTSDLASGNVMLPQPVFTGKFLQGQVYFMGCKNFINGNEE